MSDAAERREAFKRWLASGEASLGPISFPQRELWAATPVPRDDISHHICTYIHVRGRLTDEECRAAVERVVERQEVLRTSILMGKNGPVQCVRRRVPVAIAFDSVSQHELESRMKAVFEAPFDLRMGPLYRVAILRRSEDEVYLVLAMHHAIGDGWTLGVFVQDLIEAHVLRRLGGTAPLSVVDESYRAWTAAELARWTPDAIGRRVGFWRQRLAGVERLWPAPAGYCGPLRRRRDFLPSEMLMALRELGRVEGATLFSVLLAGFRMAFLAWSGREDLVVGTPVANRHSASVRQTMGYFAGNVPLRGQAGAGEAFIDVLRRTHRENVEAFAHAIPFSELVRELGERPEAVGHPIYQVRFALQNHPMPDVDVPGLSVRSVMCSTGTARFDLGCELTERAQGLEIVWLDRPGMFDEASLESLHAAFVSALESAVSGNLAAL